MGVLRGYRVLTITAMMAAAFAMIVLLTCMPLAHALADGGLLAGDIAGEPASPDDLVDPTEPVDPADPTEPEVHADGWEFADGAWHYWEAGEMRTSAWLEDVEGPAIDGEEAGIGAYWIDAKGDLAMNRVVDPATKRDAGALRCVYATESGAFATGKHVVGDLVYLAKPSGKSIYGLETGNSQGILTTTKYDDGTKRRYIIDKKAHAAITGKVVKVAGWGKAYAYPKRGYIVQGVKKFDSTHLLLADANGKLLQKSKKGWVSSKEFAGTSQRYYLEPTTKDKDVLGARIGLFKVAGWGKAYAYPRKGYIARGLTKIDSKHLLLADASGKLLQRKGWVSTAKYAGSSQRYYLEPTAKDNDVLGARIGLFKVKGWGKAYADPKTGSVARGLTKFDSKHMLLADKDGKLYQKRGWLVTKRYDGNLQRYYLEPTNRNKDVMGARIGTFRVDGNLYYGVEPYGYEFRNAYKTIGDTIYYADNGGVLNRLDVVTNMYRMAQGYDSPSQYLILVDTDDTKFVVFEGWQGNWQPKFIWDCSTGAPSTPTPSGVWHVGIKGYSFGHGYTCYYYTQFNGDYLIHTRIYQEGTHILMDDAMNTRVSQGCVRLYDEDAYWVYTNVPEGTTVVTFE